MVMLVVGTAANPIAHDGALFAQQPLNLERRILAVEHTRSTDIAPLSEAVAGADTILQQMAARATGRLERPELATVVLPLMQSPNVAVRRTTANALGQMNAVVNYAALLQQERDASVRGELLVSVGRTTPAVAQAESLLVAYVSDRSATARTGALRGLESLFRLNRSLRPSPATLTALRTAFRVNTAEIPRELILLTLTAAKAIDAVTHARALEDTSAQVRRLAVAGSRQWVADPSPMVRYQALRSANSCDRAEQAVTDPDEGVALGAIDMVGDKKCNPSVIQHITADGRTWRLQAHALVALAKIAPDSAHTRLPKFVSHEAWQARVYAATAARLLDDSAVLRTLANDAEPNVRIEAMTTDADALRALDANHAGLVRAAALKLKGSPQLAGAVPKLMATLNRITQSGSATMRDPRIAILERLAEASDASTAQALRAYLGDADPAVANLAASIVSKLTGTVVQPTTVALQNVPLPSAATLRALHGATAVITMRSATGSVLGDITLELFADDAPATVATFVELADNGKYNGLTFHRIVPNFVIQGGSPGADEYDPLTTQFMKDEVGLRSHLRGTLGISTRGHDTGDGQIFVNLVDNFRLDRQYTVFARVISGMDVVDRVQEGDVMQTVRVTRKKP